MIALPCSQTLSFGSSTQRALRPSRAVTVFGLYRYDHLHDAQHSRKSSASTPSSGTVNGGQAVTIVGEGFTAATGVEFGGIAATSVVIVERYAYHRRDAGPSERSCGRSKS
jgi:hypothetical protein